MLLLLILMIKFEFFKNIFKIFFRRHPDLNWGIEDLQSPALPLGYTAFLETNLFFYSQIINTFFKTIFDYCEKIIIVQGNFSISKK